MDLQADVELLKSYEGAKPTAELTAAVDNVLSFLDSVLFDCETRVLMARRTLGDLSVETALGYRTETGMPDDVYAVWDYALPRNYIYDVGGDGCKHLGPWFFGSDEEYAATVAGDVASGILEEFCDMIDEIGSTRVQQELGIKKPPHQSSLHEQKIKSNKSRFSNISSKQFNPLVTGDIPAGASTCGNPEHIQIAKQGADALNRWRMEQTDGVLDLRGADLRGVDLRGANLVEGNLLGADLSGANLKDADLRKSNLLGVDFTNANLRDANLGGATLFVPDTYIFNRPDNN